MRISTTRLINRIGINKNQKELTLRRYEDKRQKEIDKAFLIFFTPVIVGCASFVIYQIIKK